MPETGDGTQGLAKKSTPVSCPFSHEGRRGSLGVLMPETGDGTQGLPEKPTLSRMPWSPGSGAPLCGTQGAAAYTGACGSARSKRTAGATLMQPDCKAPCRDNEDRELIAVLRYIDHSSYPSCRTGRPPLAERRPKFISVTAWSVLFQECSTSSARFNLCENCYNPLSRASRRAEALGYAGQSPPARAMADYFFNDHKPSAMECEARLRGRERIIFSKTIIAACSIAQISNSDRETMLLLVVRPIAPHHSAMKEGKSAVNVRIGC